jgi:hypothetical protein
MSTVNIGKNSPKVYGISKKLEEISFSSIRNLLSDNLISKTCKDCGYTYRERILTPAVTIIHMILAAIWPEDDIYCASASLREYICKRYSGTNQPFLLCFVNLRIKLP